MEEWKPLIYHGEWFGDTYEVSSQGKIRNVLTGKMRKLSENKQGYLQCVISRGRKRKIAIKVHRAVAENGLFWNYLVKTNIIKGFGNASARAEQYRKLQADH